MRRSLAFTSIALVLGAGAARSAVVDCTFEGDGGHQIFTYDPEQGDANSEATVKEGERTSSILVQTGPGIVSFLDIPPDGRILITTVELLDGKAVHSSQGSRDGALVASQNQGQCEQTP